MKIEQIHLSPQALDNVIISSIESSHREARGLLFGYVKGKTYFCVNSNPILHTNRKPSQVDYTNEAAVKRVVNFARLMNACEERDYTHFGGFHVHPLLENEVPNSLSVLSPNDRDKDGVVWGDAKQLKQDSWIELIVRLSKLKGKGDRCISIRPYAKKLRFDVRFGKEGKNEGYNLLLSAFELTAQKRGPLLNTRELEVMTNGHID